MAGGGHEMGPEQGAEVKSGAQTLFKGPGKATVVVKKGLTSQAFGLEAALWLLHGGRIRGA